MSLNMVQPLIRGDVKPERKASPRAPLTPEEMDTCWYCQHCSEPMREEDDGFVDPQVRDSFCSEQCRDEHVAEGWYSV